MPKIIFPVAPIEGQEFIASGKTLVYQSGVWNIKLPETQEFGDFLIPDLTPVSSSGIIPNDEYTWLSAVSKSVKSFIQQLLSRIFEINTRVQDIEARESSYVSHNHTTLPVASQQKIGDEWMDPDTLNLFKIYYDGTQKIWVQIS